METTEIKINIVGLNEGTALKLHNKFRDYCIEISKHVSCHTNQDPVFDILTTHNNKEIRSSHV